MARLISKPFRYEDHALHRMKERGITRLEVDQVIAAPDYRRPAKRPGAMRIGRTLNARESLEVIVEETPDFIRIVSVWKTYDE